MMTASVLMLRPSLPRLWAENSGLYVVGAGGHRVTCSTTVDGKTEHLPSKGGDHAMKVADPTIYFSKLRTSSLWRVIWWVLSRSAQALSDRRPDRTTSGTSTRRVVDQRVDFLNNIHRVHWPTFFIRQA
jgi:hypothetical protein